MAAMKSLKTSAEMWRQRMTRSPKFWLIVFWMCDIVTCIRSSRSFVPRGGGGETLDGRREEEIFGSLPSTVFSPSGRLRGAELAARSASSSSSGVFGVSTSSVMALRMDEFVVMIWRKPRSPHAFYDDTAATAAATAAAAAAASTNGTNTTNASSYQRPLILEDCDDKYERTSILPSSPVSILSSHLLIAAAGHATDSCVFLQRMENMAASIQKSNDAGPVVKSSFFSDKEKKNHAAPAPPPAGWSSVSSGELARAVADMVQVPTQTLGGRYGRMLASSGLILGYDGTMIHPGGAYTNSIDHYHQSINLWRIDPTGQYWNCDAASIGRNAPMMDMALLRLVAQWKALSSSSHHQSTLPTNDTPLSLENTQTVTTKNVKLLTNQDVRQYLSTLSSDEALNVAMDCLLESFDSVLATKIKQTLDHHSMLYAGIQAAIFHVSSPQQQKQQCGFLELLSWKELCHRLSSHRTKQVTKATHTEK